MTNRVYRYKWFLNTQSFPACEAKIYHASRSFATKSSQWLTFVWLACFYFPQSNKPTTRAVHSGGAKGAVAPARKTKCFFSNIVSDFAGLFLVAILVRNLTKTEFAPADKKS